VFVGIPSLPKRVIGRDSLLNELSARLQKGRYVAVEGLPAVGKTTIAAALAHREDVRNHFDSGILWASLGPQPDLMGALAFWARELGKNISRISTEEQRAQAVRDAIGQRRLLLIIDDAWQREAADLLRCGGPECCHLLTTRIKTIACEFDEDTKPAVIGELNETDSRQLLAAHAPKAFAGDPNRLHELTRAAGGLPLALELLGGYLAAPERSYFPELSTKAFEALSEPGARLGLALKRLGQSSLREMTLRETIALSLEDLDETTRGSFHDLGAFAAKPALFTLEAARAVARGGPRAMAVLIARNLVEDRASSFAVHQVISDVARTGLEEAAITRHRDYYFSLIANQNLSPAKIRAMYEQGQHAWLSLPSGPAVLDWIRAMHSYQAEEGLWRDVMEWAQRGLEIARQYGTRADEGALLANIGLAHHALGNSSEAFDHYQRALPLLEGDDAEVCVAVSNISAVHGKVGDTARQLEYAQRALDIAEKIGNRRETVRILEAMCPAEFQSGRMEASYEHCMRAAKIREEGGADSGAPPTRVLPATGMTGEREYEQQPYILKKIHGTVHSNRSYVGLNGTIALAICRDDGKTFWWRAVFENGRKSTAGFLDHAPQRWNALAFMSEDDATTLMETGKSPLAPNRLFIRGDLDLLERFLQYYLIAGSTFYESGEFRLLQDRYSEAEAEFDKAIARGQDDADVHYKRGMARHGQRKYAEAEEDYTAAALRGEDTAELHFRRGQVLNALERFAEAEAELSGAIDRGQDDALSYFVRGFTRWCQGKYSTAIEDLTAAFERGYSGTDALYVRGLCYQRIHEDAAAEADFARAIEGGKSGPDAFSARARCRMRLRNWKGAQDDLTLAIDSGGDRWGDLYWSRAQVRSVLQDWPGGEMDTTAAIAAGKQNGEVFYERGMQRLFADKLAEAEEDYTAAIDRGLHTAEVYYYRGRARYVLADFQGCAADLTRAIALGKDDADIYQVRASANVRLGRVDEGRADCIASEQRDPTGSSTHGCWGDLHFAERNYGAAATRYRSALEAASGSGWHFELGLALLFLGKSEEARSAYRSGLAENNESNTRAALEELDRWVAQQPDAATARGMEIDEIRKQLTGGIKKRESNSAERFARWCAKCDWITFDSWKK
jgi:tetratricopeptide (TPR) repeat protein